MSSTPLWFLGAFHSTSDLSTCSLLLGGSWKTLPILKGADPLIHLLKITNRKICHATLIFHRIQKVLFDVKTDGSWSYGSSMDSTRNELAWVPMKPPRSSRTIAGGPSFLRTPQRFRAFLVNKHQQPSMEIEVMEILIQEADD